jgi:hypothetical protein
MKRRRSTLKFDRVPKGQGVRCVWMLYRGSSAAQCGHKTRNRPAWCYAHAEALDVLERQQLKLPME